MLRLFAQSVLRTAKLAWGVVRPFNQEWPRSLKGTLFLGAFLPALALVQLGHWFGFLLDEIFFRAYRRVDISEPVFVLGIPRSGTTHLHATLNADPQFTTFSAWECFFGLSVTGRKFWRAVAHLDRLIGSPLRKTLGYLQDKAFQSLEDTHPLRLDAAEEDYFSLMPVFGCFVLVIPFPFADWLWRMGHFDRDVAIDDKERLMKYYKRCIQKHLYVHGQTKRFLSKNAGFAGLANTLPRTFPDGRFVVCVREPSAAIPSQLSAIDDAFRAFGYGESTEPMNRKMIKLLAYYYKNLADAAAAYSGRMHVVTQASLRSTLEKTIHAAYRELNIPMTYQYKVILSALSERSRQFESSHRYSLERFDLSKATIDTDFGPLFSQLSGLAGNKPALEPGPHAD